MSFIKNSKNNLSLFFLILLMSPIMDVIISFIQRNYPSFAILGSAIRGLLLAIILIYTFLFKKEKNIKIMNYIIIVLLYMIFFVFLKNILPKEIIGVIKFFFFPIMLCCFLVNNEDPKKIKNYLFISGLIYILLLIIPILTNSALSTYEHGKDGLTGWFYSPNELSGIVSLFLPFIIIKPLESKTCKNKILFTVLAILYLYTIFTIGTKTPVFATFITLGLFIIINIIKSIFTHKETKNNLINMFILILLLLTSLNIFKSGAAFNNILSQNNNYQNVISNEDNINKIENETVKQEITKKPNRVTTKKPNKDTTINENNETSLEEPKENKDYNFKKILNLIFSSRDVYLVQKFKIWNESNFITKLFGTGQIQYNGNEVIHKLIEIDIFDILFCYGIVGFIIYFIPIIFIVFIMFKYLFKNFKKFINNYENWSYYTAIALGLFISCIAGHILSAPSVSLVLAIIASSLMSKLHIFKIEEKRYLNKKRVSYILILSITSVILAIICK